MLVLITNTSHHVRPLRDSTRKQWLRSPACEQLTRRSSTQPHIHNSKVQDVNFPNVQLRAAQSSRLLLACAHVAVNYTFGSLVCTPIRLEQLRLQYLWDYASST